MRSSDGVAAVAKDRGVAQAWLYQWVAAFKKQQKGGLSFEEREELAQLRRENRRLKMARDILKKASIVLAVDDS